MTDKPTQTGFDPRAATRAGLLRLGRTSQDAGATYQAIHAYTQLLVRYPGTDTANAAVEELVALAEDLEQQGKVYTAMDIFNKLEQLL